MNLPRIQLEIYELWKTCWVPASCDLQPRILLSASTSWRQHNAWLAGNKLNYEEGVWKGRKRRNNWGVRERDVLARRKGRKPCLLFFPRASWFPPRPFTTPSNACHTGYKSGVLTSKHKLNVVQLEAISKRAVWKRERDECARRKGRKPFLLSFLVRPYPLPLFHSTSNACHIDHKSGCDQESLCST